MMDYHLRCKATDRVPLRDAFIALGVLVLAEDGSLIAPEGALDIIGPLRNQANTDWVRIGGEVAHHYNLRLPYDLRQRIIQLAAEGNATAQALIANRVRFFARVDVQSGEDASVDVPKRVFL